MAKTVAEKLRIKADTSLTFFNPPHNNHALLGGIDEDISITDGDPADIILAYIEDRKQLERNLLALKSGIKKDGALWIAYHKGSSSVDTDINRDSIAEYALKNGLKGVAMISINDNWSALRLKIVD